jgi:UDP-glucose 4-epimerase
MRVCVTGGAGFIGSHLVDRLVREGHEVVVLDDLSTGRLENLDGVDGRADVRTGDVRDRAAVAGALRGCEVVFHQAALASVARSVSNPAEVTEVNVAGTVNVLVEAVAARVRRVVFASSSSVYGDTPTLPKTEDMPLSPRSPYAASKAAGEGYLSAFSAAYGLETVALRYFNVYGPRQSPRSQYAAVVPLFVEAAVEGRRAVVHGDGLQTRDFTFVGDVVEANVLAATAPAAFGAVNVGGGRRIAVLDLLHAVARTAAAQVSPVHEPARTGDVRDSLADVSRARSLLGWKPRTSLEEGIAKTVAAARAAWRGGAARPVSKEAVARRGGRS